MSENEKEIWRGGYSGKDMLGWWLSAGLNVLVGVAATFVWLPAGIVVLSVAGLGVVVLLFQLLVRKLGVAYELSNHWLTCKQGVLSRTTDRIEVVRINDVSVTQSLIQRLAGVGNITVMSSDPSHPNYVMRGVADAVEVGDKIDAARREQITKTGVRVDTI